MLATIRTKDQSVLPAKQTYNAWERDRVLDVGLQCFAARGFRSTTIADIVAASGLAPERIAFYFRDERHIGVALAQRALVSRAADIVAFAGSDPPPTPMALRGAVEDALSAEGIPLALMQELWGEPPAAWTSELALRSRAGDYSLLLPSMEKWIREGERRGPEFPSPNLLAD